MPKPLTVWITINCRKFWNRWEYLTLLLRKLYAGQEATVRMGHGTTDWFQIGKGVCQGCILSPCLFNLPTQWTWVWEDSRSWWWTGRPGMLRFMGSQRFGHYWTTELRKHHAVFIKTAEYIMRNAGLEEAQAGIKTAGRSVSHLRYADDTTLMAESEEELKSLLMKVKKES